MPANRARDSRESSSPEAGALLKIDSYNVSTFARFLEKLSKIQDGDAALLDRSVLMFGSSLSDGDMHSPLNLPTLIAGGGNGTLKGNRHVM